MCVVEIICIYIYIYIYILILYIYNVQYYTKIWLLWHIVIGSLLY